MIEILRLCASHTFMLMNHNLNCLTQNPHNVLWPITDKINKFNSQNREESIDLLEQRSKMIIYSTCHCITSCHLLVHVQRIMKSQLLIIFQSLLSINCKTDRSVLLCGRNVSMSYNTRNIPT